MLPEKNKNFSMMFNHQGWCGTGITRILDKRQEVSATSELLHDWNV